MKTQTRITEPAPLFDADGVVMAGYSTRSLQRYEKRAIRAAPWRLKEWDFYQVSDDEKFAQFTIGHVSYAGSVSALIRRFDRGDGAERTRLLGPPFGRLGMGADAEEDGKLEYSGRRMTLRFETAADRRFITCEAEDFRSEITLVRRCPESIIVAIPFTGDRHAFYYNQKINCMAAEGFVRADGTEYVFRPDTAFGLLDWGRGVWPFSHAWYWSNGTGMVGNELFGFNLGCGFGDTSAATENALFFGGRVHKLGNVHFDIDADPMRDWRIRDDEGRLDLTMTPRFNRTTKTKFLFIDNACNQVFGRFNGRAVLDDGRAIEIKNLAAFAEHAVNHW
jgi:hypothetical protein